MHSLYSGGAAECPATMPNSHALQSTRAAILRRKRAEVPPCQQDEGGHLSALEATMHPPDTDYEVIVDPGTKL